MKRLFLLLAALALPFAAGAQTFTATLSGAAEVGGGAPDGKGIAVVTFSGNQVTYTILASGIDAPSAAHIHQGAAGVNGGVVVDLQPVFVNGTAAGTVTADAAVVANILANPGGFYMNVHTASFPDGAVRGQLASALVAEGETLLYLPLVGKTPGANNTFFVTDVRIVNSGVSTANVALEWWPAGGGTTPAATQSVAVAPGQQRVLDDVVGETFGVSAQLGVLRLVSDAPVSAVARIINDQRPLGAGTTGVAYEAIPPGDAEPSGILPFLSNASDADRGAGLGFRSNLGWFNPNASPVTLTLTARATADGAILGSKSIQIPAYGVQSPVAAFAIIDTVPASSRTQDNFYITWQASAPLFVYATTTDNRTGDSLIVW